eukprot:scaffold6941_cov214-Pinguiococcus_pyrenoidosus.AAC.1
MAYEVSVLFEVPKLYRCWSKLPQLQNTYRYLWTFFDHNFESCDCCAGIGAFQAGGNRTVRSAFATASPRLGAEPR